MADPVGEPRAVTSTRAVDVAVSVLLLAFAALMGWDNWRSGAGWASDGPKAGYFPFYLSVLLGAASLFGLAKALLDRKGAESPFVNRDQLRRVLQVLVPTFVFCLLTQWLGIYVASLFIIAGFMRFIGGIAWWKSLLTSFIFALAMFVTFDVAFDVIMPKGPIEGWLGF
jgi:hypothetical protein